MQQFTIQAPTEKEAFEKMQRLYGQDAVVLSHRDVRIGGVIGLFSRRGVEITGYTRRRAPTLARSAPGDLDPAEVERRKNEILEAIRRRGRGGLASGGAAPAATLTQAPKETTPAAAEGSAGASREILDELREIKSRLAARSGEETTPAFQHLRRLLRRNDFSEEYAAELEKRARTTLSVAETTDPEALCHAVLSWIGESIRVADPLVFRKGATRTLVVVGPSGVGTTTTIAKLAAKYGIGNRETAQKNVRIVTIDSYRIGAREQIESYSEIMQIPVSYVETAEELRKVMDLYTKSVDLILIDTIGKSPKDAVNLAKMKKILEGAGHDCETHLAVSASTKAQDITEILRQFEPFGYGAVILTKLDETGSTGNIISTLAERAKPLSYVTTGQRVPQDIERASRMRLLMNLEGFRVDREALSTLWGEERFDAEEWGEP